MNYLSGQALANGAGRIITCGYADGADARLIEVTRHDASHDESLSVTASINGHTIDFTMKMNAPHWALSAVMALAFVSMLYPDDHAALKKAANALASLDDLDGRGKRHRANIENGGTITVIDDSYNASPASMTSALISLGEDPSNGRRVAILADMLELGDATDDLHRGLVDAVSQAKPDILICFGPSMAHLTQAYQAQMPDAVIKHCDNAEAAIAMATPLLSDGDLVLVKGSNGMKTSHVVQALLARSPSEQNQHGGHHAA